MRFFPTPLFLSDRKGISVGLQDPSLRHVPTAMSLLGYSLMSDLVSGHSCSDNNIFGLIRLLFQMADSMSTSQHMIHTVYGKQVYLIRMTDRLTTRVNILSDALRLVDKTFRAWQTEFRAFAKTAHCHHDASLEFLSKYTTEINRAFTSLLRLQELDDFVRQAEKITTRELVGFNDPPRSISTELSAQLPTTPSLKSTVDALDSGFPLIIRPILDYYFSVNSKFKLNILFTIPSLTAYNEFCKLQSLTPLKYNISGVCFTGPLSHEDVMLVTCPNQRCFVHTAALHKCYTTIEVVLCPKSLLIKATHTDWLGMAWTPRSRLTFQRHHKQATDCSGLKPLLHLGARYYLATTSHTITLRTADKTTTRVSLTPLSILHEPCNSSFEDQEIGLGQCPPVLEFFLPLFQSDRFSYVPWRPATHDTTFQLHYHSLAVLPPLSFDNKKLKDLDDLYFQLDGKLTAQLRDVHHNIAKLQPVTTTTLNDALKHLAFALTILHSFIFITFFCFCRHCFSLANAPAVPPTDPLHTPLQQQHRCSNHEDIAPL